MTIRGKTWQNCKNWNLHASKIGYLLLVCSGTIGVELTTFPNGRQTFLKTGKELLMQSFENGWNRCQNRNLHIANIQIPFPVLLTTEYRVNTDNFNSVRILVMIHEKTWQLQSQNCKNWNFHTCKIGYLLPVCLRNNRRRADQITELRNSIQYLVKISKDLRMCRSTTDLFTHTHTHTQWLDGLFNAMHWFTCR